MKILSEPSQQVSVNQMKDGDIATITDWSSCTHLYVGRIVQRLGSSLITLGQGNGSRWDGLFDDSNVDAHCQVRILPKGTVIEL